ncbi:enoyl-CoA hydratase [Bosea sp. (in: a-proteobacteria)]|uniref:enoyl-CoA hydratase n=1 Tax=Bosea sp. (in: a-proteobacteria) TaxID=1871050 RepID=UPI002FC88CDC
MGEAAIRYEARDGVAHLVLDQPAKLNALTYEMWAALPQLVARAEADEAVRLLAVSGAGERAFSAGADISQFGEMRSGSGTVDAYEAAVWAGAAALEKAAKPTVALIRGICFGGGFALAMSCDLRLGAEGARFRVPAARLGLGYAHAGIATLVRRLGPGVTGDIMLSARIVEAAEALRLGIVNALWGEPAFAAEAEAYLARIAGNAPLTLRAVKRALVELGRPEAERDVASVEALIAACHASADYAEGQAAFREKREPVFRGV